MLTAQQERFCQEYARTDHATDSYRTAYPKSSPAAANTSAARLLANASICGRVRELRDEAAKARGLSREWVLTRLQKEAELAGEGSTASARVRALELLGKHVGLFADALPPPQAVVVFDLAGLEEDDRRDMLDHFARSLPRPAGEPAARPQHHAAPPVGGHVPASPAGGPAG